MATTRELIVKLAADTGQFSKAMTAQTATLNKFASTAKAIGGAVAGLFAVQKVTQFFSGVMDSAEATANMSKDIGASALEVDALSRAFENAGLEAEKIPALMQRLTLGMGELMRGGKADAFKALGLDRAAIAGRTTYEVLRMIGGQVADLGSIEATGILKELFGKANAMRLQEALGDLTETEGKIRGIYDALGLTDKAAQDIEALGDEFSDLKDTMDLIGRVALSEMAPSIIKATEESASAMIKFGRFYKTYYDVIGAAMEKAKDQGWGRFWQTAAGVAAIPAALFGQGTESVQDLLNQFGPKETNAFQAMGKELESMYKREQAYLESLESRAEKVRESIATPKQKFDEEKKGLDELLGAQTITWDEYIAKIALMEEELNKANPQLQELKKVLEDNVDPMAAFVAQAKKLEGWRGLGLLDEGSFQRAMDKLKKGMFGDYTVQVRETEQRMKELSEQYEKMNAPREGTASTASSLSEIIGRSNEGRQDYARETWTELRRANVLLEMLVGNMRTYVPVYG